MATSASLESHEIPPHSENAMDLTVTILQNERLVNLMRNTEVNLRSGWKDSHYPSAAEACDNSHRDSSSPAG